jgi:hypothetical protein
MTHNMMHPMKITNIKINTRAMCNTMAHNVLIGVVGTVVSDRLCHSRISLYHMILQLQEDSYTQKRILLNL